MIVCVSDHNDDALNLPYVEDGLPGEVAAVDRPIIQPVVSVPRRLGDRAAEHLQGGLRLRRPSSGTTPFAEFPYITDPQHFADHVLIKYRADQPGVRRINDFDEYGEAYSDPHSEKTNYGQPVVFHKNGDPEAYLHKSLPGTVNGGTWPAPFQEAFADQTSALGLLTFTAQGDLPIRWTVKASLATEDSARYGRAHGRRPPRVGGLVAGLLRRWREADDAAVPGHQQPGPGHHDGRQPAAADGRRLRWPDQTITREITTVQTVAGAHDRQDRSRRRRPSRRASRCMRRPRPRIRQGQEARHEAVPPALAA